MVLSQVCLCLILAFELRSAWQHIFIWINHKTTNSEQVKCNTIVSFCKAFLMCLGLYKSTEWGSWILHAFQSSFFSQAETYLEPCARKREQRQSGPPCWSHVASSGLGTSFTIPSVLAVHVLLEPSFELSQLVLGSVDHLWSGKQVSAAHAVIN